MFLSSTSIFYQFIAFVFNSLVPLDQMHSFSLNIQNPTTVPLLQSRYPSVPLDKEIRCLSAGIVILVEQKRHFSECPLFLPMIL